MSAGTLLEPWNHRLTFAADAKRCQGTVASATWPGTCARSGASPSSKRTKGDIKRQANGAYHAFIESWSSWYVSSSVFFSIIIMRSFIMLFFFIIVIFIFIMFIFIVFSSFFFSLHNLCCPSSSSLFSFTFFILFSSAWCLSSQSPAIQAHPSDHHIRLRQRPGERPNDTLDGSVAWGLPC